MKFGRRAQRFSRLILACALLTVAGCAAMPAAAPVAAGPVLPGDPVLRAVAAGAVGTAVQTTSGVVAVRSDYTSAAGHDCRAYDVNGGPAALACTDGANWRIVPALTETGL